MIDIGAVESMKKCLDLNNEKVAAPQRFVDFDVTSSFAHCNPNLTSDELFGYATIDRLFEKTDGKINLLLCDYDGTFPEKEKPAAFSLETILVNNQTSSLERNVFSYAPLLFESRVPLGLQPFHPERILRGLEQPWESYIKRSGFQKNDRSYVIKRFSEIVEAIKNSVLNSGNVKDFLKELRKKFLHFAGISSFGVPESCYNSLFAQKLEEDLESGFPFWEMELPFVFEAKHKSNDRTYLFWGIGRENTLTSVQFYSSPSRFEFTKEGKKIVIPAEESPEAMRRGTLIPTVSLLNYIVLSPARKKPSSERKKRIHIAGSFMAGSNGYARELFAYFNKKTGFDSVSLICTDYDDCLKIKNKQGDYLSFGSVYPQFGKEGIHSCLYDGGPQFLKRGEVYYEKS